MRSTLVREELRDVTAGRVREESSLGWLLPRALDGALALAVADFGNIQLVDPDLGALRIVAQSGFDGGFLDHFARVDDTHAACGRAASERRQAVIVDTDQDGGFAPHRRVAARAGFRAVQSTPLVDRAGRFVGVLSTHSRRPHLPRPDVLRGLQLYADLVGEMLAAQLPTGLSPVDGVALDRPVGGDGKPGPVTRSFPGDELAHLADSIVSGLFGLALQLDGARSMVDSGPASVLLEGASGEVDRLIVEVRALMSRRAGTDD